MIIILSIGNTQISILLLCFLYLFAELMITMNYLFLFLFKPNITFEMALVAAHLQSAAKVGHSGGVTSVALCIILPPSVRVEVDVLGSRP